MRLPNNLKQDHGTKTLDSQIGKTCQHSYKDPSKVRLNETSISPQIKEMVPAKQFLTSSGLKSW